MPLGGVTIFYILSVAVHVGCFLAIMNIAAIIIGVKFLCEQVFYYLGYDLGMELLGHMVTV